MNNCLTVKSINLQFDNKLIFKNISFTASAGTITVLKGKNGSGKTSLLRCLCDIENHNNFPPDNILYNNIPVYKQKNKIPYIFGYLMQEPDKQICFPFIEEELFFGAENLNKNTDIINQDYDFLTELFPFLKRTDIETNALSFGQKKMLLFSGMVLKAPYIFLLDEPSVGLSDNFKNNLYNILKLLLQKGKIIIIAEHNDYFDGIANGCIHLS